MKIVSHRFNPILERTEFLVEWTNWNLEDSTWVIARQLESLSLKQSYWQGFPHETVTS